MRKALSGVLLLALVAGLGIAWLVDTAERAARQPLANRTPVELEIPRGKALQQVLADLDRAGHLEGRLWLRLWLRWHQRGDHIQAGEYLIGPGTTFAELIAMLEAGRVRTHSVTLVEGWTVAQVRQLLARQSKLQSDTAAVPADHFLHVLGIDAEPGRSPEGLFFPDTYVFSGRTSDADVLRQAYERLQTILKKAWAERAQKLPYDSPYEALIMASIVERETGVPSERSAIAGVFVRRLQRGMRLQTDPTVIYGLGEAFDGNLRRAHLLDDDNPYNTYRIAGLPPTPIGLAGRAAIEASLQPAGGEALYFVARGDGSHYFSKTLAEHRKAVRRYQIEQRRADYRSRPAP